MGGGGLIETKRRARRERKQAMRSLDRCISCGNVATTRNHCAFHAEQSSRAARNYYWSKRANPLAAKARNDLNRAIARGEIRRPSHCSRCGVADRKINGHHHDYTKPLDVTWLCYRCHADVEGKVLRSP